MKNLDVLFLIGTLLFTSCSESDSKKKNPELIETESSKAEAFFKKVFDERVERHPEFQTQLGIKKDYDEWDDYSNGFIDRENRIAQDNLNYLKDSIDKELLDEKTRLSYELLHKNLSNELTDYEYRHHNLPLNQKFGFQSSVPSFLINFHKINSESDAKAYISRLEAIPELFDQRISGLKDRERKGIILPRFLFHHVKSDINNLLKGFPFDNSADTNTIFSDFYTKVKALELEDEKSEALLNKSSEVLRSAVRPAYQGLRLYINQLEKKAKDATGVWDWPKGNEYYAHVLKTTTTTELQAEEIHEIGLQEVARIQDEMRKIMKEVKFSGTLPEFFKFMKNAEVFYFPNTEEGRNAYLDSATLLINLMKHDLDKLFTRKPKADMVVKKVESFREKSAGKAFYNRPSPDGSRPGTYYVNLYDMKAMPSYEMEALAYHEGIPGHHMQIAIAQELEGIPDFRKYGLYTAYLEGWALYSEYLTKEIGKYQNPYSDFGRLAMELWRACRLVVDTGIHHKKWIRQEAIDYYVENTPAPLSQCEKMVERHFVIPAQATAYKIGMLKIIELKNLCLEKLGSEFDIREFHNLILSNGAVPLDVLEKMVEEYIAVKLS
ncbi:MAG: DUF885 domain-containing protein [Bacteroidota bacterium]